MSYFTYDTSVILSRRLTALPQTGSKFRLSSVVLMELATNANDASHRKMYEQLFQTYRNDNSLIVPNEDDWLLASKVPLCSKVGLVF